MKYWLRVAYAIAWSVWFAVAIPLAVASLIVREWLVVPRLSAESTTEGIVLASVFFGWFYLSPGLLLLGRNYLARRLNAPN